MLPSEFHFGAPYRIKRTGESVQIISVNLESGIASVRRSGGNPLKRRVLYRLAELELITSEPSEPTMLVDTLLDCAQSYPALRKLLTAAADEISALRSEVATLQSASDCALSVNE